MSATAPAGRRPRPRLAPIAAVPVLAAFAAGNLATFPNLPWYQTLRKPPFNPPDWVFGPAWTVLYILMAVAFYRVLALSARPGRTAAIAAFLMQIALNAGWSLAFFAAHDPALGLAVILALLVAILVTGVLFYRLDQLAGLCFVPYVAWVCFATALDGAITGLNAAP